MFLILVVSVVYQSRDKTTYNRINFVFTGLSVYSIGENAKFSVFICDVTAELMYIN